MSTAGTAGMTGGPNLGPAFVIDGETVIDANGTSGVAGAIIAVESPMGSDITLAPGGQGEICVSGTVGIVQNADYTNYWGVEVDLDLNRAANPDAEAGGGAPAPVADAGDAGATDAGGGGGPVLGELAAPWDPTPGDVIGFSFVLEGPMVPAAFRFKTQPTGTDSATQSFCKPLSPASGVVQNVLFRELAFNCWDGPDGEKATEYPTLQNVGWQIPASDQIAYPFDFCIKDIRPILTP
jgi:hypothetical protein